MRMDTLKLLVYFAVLATGFSLLNYGTQNGIAIYTTTGIALMFLQATAGIIESVRDMSDREPEEVNRALNELNTYQGRKFMTVLTASIVLLLTFWGVGYTFVLTSIQSLPMMIITSFAGMILGSLMFGIPIVWYTLRVLKNPSQ